MTPETNIPDTDPIRQDEFYALMQEKMRDAVRLTLCVIDPAPENESTPNESPRR